MSIVKKLSTWVGLLACLGISALAQDPPLQDPLLEHMVGNWVLEGTIARKQTTHDVSVEWVLVHHYLRIHETSHEKDANGQPAYEANVYIGWDSTLKQYACVWLDTYGGISPVSLANAKRAGDEIAFVFKDPDSLFHTTFIYHSKSDWWEWKMDSEKNGAFTPFARAKLTKKT